MSAIVPYRAADAKVVQFAADGVAADVRVQPLDRANRSSVYALRLASSEMDVTGRLVGVLAGGDAVELGALAVAPGSIGSARVTVAAPRASHYEAVYLEIRSESVLLRVEAPKPPAPRRARPLTVGAALVALGAVSLGGGSLAFALPQTPMLGAPDHAVAGSSVRIPYVSHGYGALAYTARYDDGSVFASGALGAPRGEIALALPATSAHRRVSLALSVRGPLGAAVGDAAFAVAAPPPPAVASGARVLSFAARRDASATGESVLVSYLAQGERGTVVLLDPRGTIVASAPFARVGTTRLPVAAAYRAQVLTAKIGVDRGGTHAVASVMIPPALAAPLPVHRDLVPPQADPNAPEGVTPVDRSVRAPGSGIIAVDGDAIAGGSLAVRVMAHATPMELALQDATGETVAQREIAPGTTHLALALPPAPQTLFLVLRYTRNGGEETIVRSVRALPTTTPASP